MGSNKEGKIREGRRGSNRAEAAVDRKRLPGRPRPDRPGGSLIHRPRMQERSFCLVRAA
jgi:hypothetical protein